METKLSNVGLALKGSDNSSYGPRVCQWSVGWHNCSILQSAMICNLQGEILVNVHAREMNFKMI